MQASALSLSLVGLDAFPVRVEVDSGRGPACFYLVGLAEARAAMIPRCRLTGQNQSKWRFPVGSTIRIFLTRQRSVKAA